MMEQPKDWNIQFLDVNDNVKYQISTFGTEDKAVKFARKLELRWRTRPASERVNKEKGKPIRSRRNRL